MNIMETFDSYFFKRKRKDLSKITPGLKLIIRKEEKKNQYLVENREKLIKLLFIWPVIATNSNVSIY